MKTILLMISAVWAINGYSDATILEANGETYFDQLAPLFEQGTLPSVDEAKGIWAGRCYRKNAPNSIHGAFVLLIIENEVGQGNGPLFPPTKIMNLALAGNADHRPDLFDNPTEAIRQGMRDYSHGDEFKGIVMESDGRSLYSIFALGDTRFDVRKSNEYYILQAVALAKADDINIGDVFSRCYFFKKVD